MAISFSAREIATTVCGGLFVWIAGNVAAANIKTFLSKRGYDAFLDRWAEHPILVRLCSRMIAGWQPMRKRWWLWLALGLSGGFSTALWVMPSAEIQSPPQESMQIPTPPATPPTPVHAVYNERDIRELLDSLDEASTLLEKHILPTAAATNGMTVNWFGAISYAVFCLKKKNNYQSNGRDSSKTQCREPQRTRTEPSTRPRPAHYTPRHHVP